MKRLVLALFILALTCFAFSPPPVAVTYYCDTASSGGNGTTQLLTGATAAFQHIAEVNAASFAAGDSILFKRGCTWREQLTIPSSGSADLPITFGAYGTGDDPIIDGSDIVIIWTLDSAWQNSIAATDDSTTSGTYNIRTYISANTSSYSGTKVKLTMKAITADLVITGSSVGISTTGDDYDAAPTRITWDSGSNGTTITAGTSKTSDEITFTFTKTNRHLVAFCFTSGNYRYDASGVSGVGIYYGSDTPDSSQDQTVTLTGPVAGRCDIIQLEVMASGTANVYNATVAATPLQVFKDDVRITLGASKAALNDHEWFSSGITLSMRDDTGDPDVQAYVITASVRNYGIYGSGKSYITLNDLITTKANLDGVYFDTYTDNIVDGCTATYSVQAGVQFHSPVGTGGICRNSILAYNGIAGQPVLVGVDMAGTENTIIENNDIYGNYIGLECDQGSSGNIVRYNKIHDNVTTGININNSDSNQVYYNLIYGNGSVSLGAFGISMFDSSSGTCTGNQIYNNTFSDNSYVGIDIRTEQTNLKIKNNIFSQNYGYAAPNAEMWIYSGFTFGGLEIDNNNYYHSDPAADPYWNLRCWWYGTIASLTYKTWAEWKALTIGGINPDASYSLNSDPKVTSTVTPDFHLQPTSPCINAGVNVGLTQDYEGNRTPRGPRPDIGAYEFQPKRGWLLLLFGIK